MRSKHVKSLKGWPDAGRICIQSVASLEFTLCSCVIPQGKLDDIKIVFNLKYCGNKLNFRNEIFLCETSSSTSTVGFGDWNVRRQNVGHVSWILYPFDIFPIKFVVDSFLFVSLSMYLLLLYIQSQSKWNRERWMIFGISTTTQRRNGGEKWT